jgi:hypothetical protein
VLDHSPTSVEAGGDPTSLPGKKTAIIIIISIIIIIVMIMGIPVIPHPCLLRSIFKGRPEVPLPLAQDPVADWVDLGEDRFLDAGKPGDQWGKRGKPSSGPPM